MKTIKDAQENKVEDPEPLKLTVKNYSRYLKEYFKNHVDLADGGGVIGEQFFQQDAEGYDDVQYLEMIHYANTAANNIKNHNKKLNKKQKKEEPKEETEEEAKARRQHEALWQLFYGSK